MLAAALAHTGFELCEFEPDECESCHKLAQLYFSGPTDAGRYFCAECVMAESKDNWLTDREAECRLNGLPAKEAKEKAMLDWHTYMAQSA